MNLSDVQNQFSSELNSMETWCKELYDTMFSMYFKDHRMLASKLRSQTIPISDEQLEWILTQVPLNLFDASEKLSTLRTRYEVIRLASKEKEYEAYKRSEESTESKRREAAAVATTEDKILLVALENILNRVDKEMSYSRELIMSAKKIYDGRKQTERSNPVSEVRTKTDDLPEYYSETMSGRYA